MANLAEQPVWEQGIYQIEVTDTVHAGPPDVAQRIGVANAGCMQLANRTGWLRQQIENVMTPIVSVLVSNAAMDAINATSVWSVGQGVLNPPLAIGGIIEHAELADGSAIQRAYRIAPAGTFLTKHIRIRRTGAWSVWTADGPDVGDLVIQSHNSELPDRIEASGAALSRASYADLFDRVGVTYGEGDGASTFNIVDSRAEFLRGWDSGRGLDVGRVFGSAQDGTKLTGEVLTLASNDGLYVTIRNSDVTTETERFSDTGGGHTTARVTTGGKLENNLHPAADTGLRKIVATHPRNIAQQFCVKY